MTKIFTVCGFISKYMTNLRCYPKYRLQTWISLMKENIKRDGQTCHNISYRLVLSLSQRDDSIFVFIRKYDIKVMEVCPHQHLRIMLCKSAVRHYV